MTPMIPPTFLLTGNTEKMVMIVTTMITTASPEEWVFDDTIDINENTNPYFSGSIIDNEAGNPLNFLK